MMMGARSPRSDPVVCFMVTTFDCSHLLEIRPKSERIQRDTQLAAGFTAAAACSMIAATAFGCDM